MASDTLKPFGYFCDWGDYDGLQRIAMYYGEPGSGSINDWNVAPKVHHNLPLYSQDAIQMLQRDLSSARAECERLRKDAGECAWTVDTSYEGDTWDGSCGAKWTFTEGGPKDNNFHFCHKCGRPVKAIDSAIEREGRG